MYSFASNIILNIRMTRTSEESFLPRLSFELISFNTVKVGGKKYTAHSIRPFHQSLC